MKVSNKQYAISNTLKGFTLIELLVVISIIGILTVLLIANFMGTRERARDTQRKSDMRMMKTALMMYYNSCGAYPDDSAVTGGGQIEGCGGATATCTSVTACSWGQTWSMGGTDYMKLLPKDPLDAQNYTYEKRDDNSFTLVSLLENMSDEAGETSRTQCGYTHVAGKNEYVVCED
jgi:general secretion pathway protein G